MLSYRSAFWVFLFPLACVWAIAARYRRYRWRNRRAVSSLPIVCVGNLHSGGSGKTPLVIAIAEKLADRRPAILSRGYGVEKQAGPRLLDRQHPAGPHHFGDEPWMMATRIAAPIWICADRRQAVREIEKAGESALIILDDGFQHLPLAARVNLIVIGADRHPDDSYCLPLGELREPWSALREAHAVVLTRGSDSQNENAWRTFLSERFPDLPVFAAQRTSGTVADSTGSSLPAGARVGTFAGIAAPQRFIDDIGRQASLAFSISFPDHHVYRERDIDRILAEKKRTGATHLVTTEKDRAKIETLFAQRGEPLWFSRIDHELPEQFWYFLRTRLETP